MKSGMSIQITDSDSIRIKNGTLHVSETGSGSGTGVAVLKVVDAASLNDLVVPTNSFENPVVILPTNTLEATMFLFNAFVGQSELTINNANGDEKRVLSYETNWLQASSPTLQQDTVYNNSNQNNPFFVLVDQDQTGDEIVEGDQIE
jgi:hypothetical protein